MPRVEAAPKPPASHTEEVQKRLKTCNKCDFVIYSDLHLKKHMKVKHGVKEKILWVGDSINCNLDFNYIARQTDMDVIPAKAYAAAADAPGSKFPKNNFLDVVEKELEGDDFKVLVLGGGNVEITNLNTIENTDDNIASFKDGILTATQMLFSIAETALQTYPELQKVIFLRRPPRFDPVGVDPLQLKPHSLNLATPSSLISGATAGSRTGSSWVIT